MFNHAGFFAGDSRCIQAAHSWMTAQQPIPVAIAEADATTPERFPRAEIELIVGPAMVRAITMAAERIGYAVVAETAWQRLRHLPIHANHRSIGLQLWCLGGKTEGDAKCPPQNRGRDRKRLHSDSPAKLVVMDGASTVSVGSTDDGRRAPLSGARLIGSRTPKRVPLPSLLCTAMLPP